MVEISTVSTKLTGAQQHYVFKRQQSPGISLGPSAIHILRFTGLRGQADRPASQPPGQVPANFRDNGRVDVALFGLQARSASTRNAHSSRH